MKERKREREKEKGKKAIAHHVSCNHMLADRVQFPMRNSQSAGVLENHPQYLRWPKQRSHWRRWFPPVTETIQLRNSGAMYRNLPLKDILMSAKD